MGCVMIGSKSKSEAGHPSVRPLKAWYLARMLAAFVAALLSSVCKMRLAWGNYNVDNLSVCHVCTICSHSKISQILECNVLQRSPSVLQPPHVRMLHNIHLPNEVSTHPGS
jgi:hypothetical protein